MFTLPGFGLPLVYWGATEDIEECSKSLSAVQDWYHEPSTIRERCMLAFMNEISDKPDWNVKVQDEEIVAKWRKEAIELDWQAAGIKYGDMSESMFGYCIKELREKAKLFGDYGFIPVFDTTSTIMKADGLIPTDIKADLKRAAAVLEDVPEAQKDWHPGSNNQVLDLVHPSLYPLIYGRSRILPDTTINIEDCLRNIGGGEIIPDQDMVEEDVGYGYERSDVSLWSNHFQWLPCNISFPDGVNTRIDSYINNLHPVDHKDLYNVIEKIITKTLPMWNIAYQLNEGEDGNRVMKPKRVEYRWPDDLSQKRPLDPDEDPESDERHERDQEYERTNRILIKPEPRDYKPHPYTPDKTDDPFKFLNGPEKNLQVIVKLANIHLTPNNPEYAGGSWHVEGQLNEHIVSTALYYYDNHNITPSHLHFRTGLDSQCLDWVRYEQGDFKGIKRIFGFKNFSRPFQDVGAVLTREDRMLVFPNGFQHRVGSFKLADPTLSGHRKILALFLVDPHIPIISTANVPPQQREWWLREMRGVGGRLEDLPAELWEQVMQGVDEFPIGMEEAKTVREELMQERGRMSEVVDEYVAKDEFSFCEH